MSDRRKRCRGPWNLWKGASAAVQVGSTTEGHAACSPALLLDVRTGSCAALLPGAEAGACARTAAAASMDSRTWHRRRGGQPTAPVLGVLGRLLGRHAQHREVAGEHGAVAVHMQRVRTHHHAAPGTPGPQHLVGGMGLHARLRTQNPLRLHPMGVTNAMQLLTEWIDFDRMISRHRTPLHELRRDYP